MTRYKLDIPDHFLPILSDTHRALNGKKVKVIEYAGEYCFVNHGDHGSFFKDAKVFVSWLIDIKEEPWRKYFDETYKYYSKGKETDGFYLDIKEAFQAGEEYNELRHREKFSYRQWCLENSIFYDEKLESPSALAWQACKESHNIK